VPNVVVEHAVRRKLSGDGSAMPPKNARDAFFQLEFLQDLRYWVKVDRKLALRVLDLVDAITRDPFHGIGKPEPMRYVLAGCWSRRITQEHRLVYRVSQERIDFLQARYHY
jgi:toxin YoeB